MPRIGIVIETTDQSAQVSTRRRGVCEGCSDRSSCSFENALGQDKPEIVVVQNPIAARPGQTVEFDLMGHTELKISLLVWIVPLVGLIAGATVGAFLHERFSLNQDPATLIGAAIGLVAAFVPIMLYDRLAAGKAKYVPCILKVIDPSSCPDLPRDTNSPD